MNKHLNNSDKSLSDKLFMQREENLFHLPYEREIDFYETVQQGDVNKLEKIFLPLKSKQLGHLSDNNLRNLKYHLTITIALITRFCIEGGLPPETAYTLSDLYIYEMDNCTTEEQISDLHKKAVMDFAGRMKNLKKETVMSRPIIHTIDYIYEHLHEKIKLDEIANAVSLNKTYLCKLFKKETGQTLNTYISKLKIEAAANMLAYSDYSVPAISNYFSFSSHSHFIKVFKQYKGITPKEYKNTYYRKHWDK